MIHIDLNKDINKFDTLKSGNLVYLSGTVYTARDAAHLRMKKLIDDHKPLPFELENNGIYYVGPCESQPGMVYGSAGPTTSSRMDVYTSELLDRGLKYTIGKGKRSKEVKEAIVRNKAIYFIAAGGAGALYANCVTKVEDVAFDDLLSEAIKKLTIVDFPVFVGIDTKGNDIYEGE